MRLTSYLTAGGDGIVGDAGDEDAPILKINFYNEAAELTEAQKRNVVHAALLALPDCYPSRTPTEPKVLPSLSWDATPPLGVDYFRHRLTLMLPLVTAADRIFYASRGTETELAVRAGVKAVAQFAALPSVEVVEGHLRLSGRFDVRADHSLSPWAVFVESASFRIPINILPAEVG